jgi:hypothetical protein
MNIFKLLVISVVFILCNGYVLGQHQDWKLAKSGNGVEIFTREREGGKIKEYKALMVVNSPVHLIEKQLDNVNDYPNWQDNCDYAKVIEKPSSNVQFERYYTDTPWPITDRDLVMKMVKEKRKDGSISYKRTSAPDKFPVDKDFMRIQEAGGEWLLEPLGENKSKLTYQFYANPGGSLPAWLVNSFIVQGPYNTFNNLKKRVEQ